MKTLAQNVLTADRQKPAEQQQYADVTAITDSNYFPIASLERLGTAQEAQFQSGDQYGATYHWGSRKNESGEIIVSTDETNTAAANSTPGRDKWHQGNGIWLESNNRADMPRSYDTETSGYGGYYNWYAATAESGTWSSTSRVNDSLCPKGWKLPIDSDDASTANSWKGLLFGTYELSSNSNSAKAMRQPPLSITLSGFYNLVPGTVSRQDSGGNYWSTTASGNAAAQSLTFDSSSISPRTGYHKPSGLTVRCIRDGTQ